MNAVSYSRCSTVGQQDGDSFSRQADPIERLAAFRQLTLVACFFEAITGTTEDRPAFNQMLDWCVANGVKYILIERMDRLARKFSVGETLIAMCRKLGLEIIDCSTGETLTDDDPSPDAWLNASFRLLIAEWEKRNMVYRTGTARRRIRKERGKCEGRKGNREMNPQAVQRARELRGEGMIYKEIAATLQLEQVPTLNGGRWRASTVHQMLNGGRA